jgi:Mce-associated membrane protein
VRVAGQRSRRRPGEPAVRRPIADEEEPSAEPTGAVDAETGQPDHTATTGAGQEHDSTATSVRTDAATGSEAGAEDLGLSPASGGRSRRFAVTVLGGLVVLAVLLGAATGLTLYFGRQHDATHAARGQALAAAKRAAASINSYSYKHFDKDTKAAAKHFTAHFRKDYQQLTSKIRPTVRKYHAVVLASPNGAAAREVTSDQAVVLVSLNQITTSSKLKNPRLDKYRMRLSMVKRDGHWLVNDETAV